MKTEKPHISNKEHNPDLEVNNDPYTSYIILLVSLCQWQSQGVLREADRLTVAPHVCVAADGVPHLCERQVGHCDGAAAQHLEARLAVERNEEIFTHQHSSANVGQAAEILQVTPHQNGSFALLPEGAMDSEDVDVDSGATRFVQGQGVLKQSGYRPKLRCVCFGTFCVSFKEASDKKDGCGTSYCCESVLVPEGADDKSH